MKKGMFGSEFESKKDAIFHYLRCGQMRSSDKVSHNGGWYNEKGEKLGWGDLSVQDLLNIKRDLVPGEAFIVLSESDSFWNFVQSFGPIGSMCTTAPTAEAPGVDYIVKHARFAVFPGVVYYIDSPWGQFGALPRESLKRLLTTS